MHRSIFLKAYAMLNFSQKRKGVVIISLLAFQSLLDFFSIASFLPLIFLIISPAYISRSNAINSVYQHLGFTTHGSFIIAVTLLVLFFTMVKGFISARVNRYKAQYIFNMGEEISSRALAHYLEIGYPAFSGTNFSRESNRIMNYPITFANSFVLPVANLISEGIVCICIIACIAVYDSQIILLILVILIPALIFHQRIRQKAKLIGTTIKEKYPLAMKYVHQIIEGLIEIKLYRRDHFFKNRFDKTNKELKKVFISDNVVQNSVTRLTEIVTAMIVCFLIIYTVLSGYSYQNTILLLSIYASASFRIVPSINRIFISSFQIRAHEYLVDELMHLVNFKAGKSNQKDAQVSFEHTIELKNISYGYPGKNLVLQGTGLTIRKGMKIALTGKSGEGKTTLLLVLLGFITDYQGEILIDGKSVHAPASIRNLLGYVPQNPYILDGTILENVAFGIPAEDIDKSKVLRLLDELDLLEMTQSLPQGVDTQIGERGMKLSGGQRQRLCIARALYADAAIFLLDEITNQVHSEMELDILDMLDRLAHQEKTIIMVTHKIIDKHFFDAVYALEKGQLKEVQPA
jgi:ABC-type multidrug transport system fused ATPase/permease subunit